MVGAALILGARTSPLSRAQVDEALPVLRRTMPGVTWEARFFTSPGDRDLKTSLESGAAPTDFFTRDLDERLLSGELDLCVHSAKDLPNPMPDGLVVAALRPAMDIRDALVFREGIPRDAPPHIIGTSSVARRAHLQKIFPAAQLKSIRGAIQDRLRQLDAGDYDAVVVAACALDRLGLTSRVGMYLPYDPAPQQSRLAFVVRADDARLRDALQPLDVRRTAGWVGLLKRPYDSSQMDPRTKGYLRRADVILSDREPHSRLLAEAESGKWVVWLHEGDASATARFLADWNIRFDRLPASDSSSLAPSPIPDYTLFTGTHPEPFLRYGPFLYCPLIRLEPIPLDQRVQTLRDVLGDCRGMVFPSRIAVTSTLEALRALGDLNQTLRNMPLLAVGPATADRIRENNLPVTAAPEDWGGVESLTRMLGPELAGRYFYPCSDVAPIAERTRQLQKLGIELRPHVFYRNTPVESATLPDPPFSRVLFTSGSTVRAYFKNFPEEQSASRIWLVVGASAMSALRDLGLTGELCYAKN